MPRYPGGNPLVGFFSVCMFVENSSQLHFIANMFKVLLTEFNITISLDSNDPDTSAIIEFEGDDPVTVETIREQVDGMYGIYGHSISDETTPLDLNAALGRSVYNFQILEGADILKMPRQKLPPGAKW